MTGRIVQINVSPGGVPKRPVPRARVMRSGIEGDAHRDTERHGGPDRALCLFSLEQIETLQVEGHPVEPGVLGENLTIAGLDWPRVQPEDVFRLGTRSSSRSPASRAPAGTSGRRSSMERTRGSPSSGTPGGAACTRASSCRGRSPPATRWSA